ncbi:hypothetical protein Vadar_030957 [Vaccinium darrowii]|uniref:Uncharacterized protein n=1 Tax=Vaccinium darrowii TaxID=229202 RepID=A0ACB7YT15_9ERIC|nr:hypothetical protein Vadar_030957 [Vaccinium darrowii]
MMHLGPLSKLSGISHRYCSLAQKIGFQGGAETIKGMGIYFDRWLIVMKEREPNPFKGFIQTLAVVVGGEKDAREKICSVSLGHYNVFGALIDETTALQIKALPREWTPGDIDCGYSDLDVEDDITYYIQKDNAEGLRSLLTYPDEAVLNGRMMIPQGVSNQFCH